MRVIGAKSGAVWMTLVVGVLLGCGEDGDVEPLPPQSEWSRAEAAFGAWLTESVTDSGDPCARQTEAFTERLLARSVERDLHDAGAECFLALQQVGEFGRFGDRGPVRPAPFDYASPSFPDEQTTTVVTLQYGDEEPTSFTMERATDRWLVADADDLDAVLDRIRPPADGR